jgi:hypothetical protein
MPCDSYTDLQVKLLQEARKSREAMVCSIVHIFILVLTSSLCRFG